MYNGLVLCTGKINLRNIYISKSSLLTLFLIISGCPHRQHETWWKIRTLSALCDLINQSKDDPDPHIRNYSIDTFVANTAVVYNLKTGNQRPGGRGNRYYTETASLKTWQKSQLCFKADQDMNGEWKDILKSHQNSWKKS